MWEWIQTWTFWNWITIILIIPALVGFLNAILSLKSRFTDWKAKRNKELLKKRLLELEQDAIDTKFYHREPATLLIDLLYKLDSPVLSIMISFVASLFAIVILAPKMQPSIYLVPILFGLWINVPPRILGYINLINKKIGYFYNPSAITKKAEKLIEDAKTLGVISEVEINTIQKMIAEKRLKDAQQVIHK